MGGHGRPALRFYIEYGLERRKERSNTPSERMRRTTRQAYDGPCGKTRGWREASGWLGRGRLPGATQGGRMVQAEGGSLDSGGLKTIISAILSVRP